MRWSRVSRGMTQAGDALLDGTKPFQNNRRKATQEGKANISCLHTATRGKFVHGDLLLKGKGSVCLYGCQEKEENIYIWPLSGPAGKGKCSNCSDGKMCSASLLMLLKGTTEGSFCDIYYIGNLVLHPHSCQLPSGQRHLHVHKHLF